MKAITVLALLLIISPAFSQDQEIKISAGTNLSYLKGSDLRLHDMLGYYVGIEAFSQVGKKFKFGAGLEFINQMSRFKGYSSSVQNASLMFMYRFYPQGSGFYLGNGFQVNYITKSRVDESTIDGRKYRREQAQGLLSAGYDFGKMSVSARFASYITTSDFSHMFQVGASYRIK